MLIDADELHLIIKLRRVQKNARQSEEMDILIVLLKAI